MFLFPKYLKIPLIVPEGVYFFNADKFVLDCLDTRFLRGLDEDFKSILDFTILRRSKTELFAFEIGINPVLKVGSFGI